ncbi:MAG: dihydroorotate dehydrogenase electron transfer subunit [Nanoarchaeota archaeon]|nr:dihydroorotate dehydrogenase electron transfer subunit [Nanoarchaeota archaeon]
MKNPTLQIEKIVDETKDCRSFFFESEKLAQAQPGQFFMVWVPGVDEFPLAASYTSDSDGTFGITVEAVGDGTRALYDSKIGDHIGIRGPYGNGFEITGKNILLVCGGRGTIPLALLAENAAKKEIKIDAILGARSADKLLFKDRLEKATNVSIATDDGSAGVKGFVTGIADEMLGKNKYDCVYTCGPEIMMFKLLAICEKNNVPMQASLERYMKCGIGICGSCACGSVRICKKNVMASSELKELSAF